MLRKLFIVFHMFLTWALPSQASFQPQKLPELLQKVAKHRQTGHSIPVVVFDLDETLVNSSPRRWLSYQETLRQMGNADPVLLGQAGKMNLLHIERLPNRYDPRQLFYTLGIQNELFIREASDRMLQIYLSGRYLEHDQEIPGATAYVRSLVRAGAKIIFVSSRWEDTQGAATQLSLARLKLLPRPHSFQLLLRPRRMNSLEFKKFAYSRIQQMERDGRHRVVAAFENEPENEMALQEYFPKTELFHIEGAAMKDGPLPARVIRLQNYFWY